MSGSRKNTNRPAKGGHPVANPGTRRFGDTEVAVSAVYRVPSLRVDRRCRPACGSRCMAV